MSILGKYSVIPAKRFEPFPAWYLCAHCHEGRFPVDEALDVAGTDFSPGVRRMQALVGQDAPFDHGRQHMKVLAGLEVTA